MCFLLSYFCTCYPIDLLNMKQVLFIISFLLGFVFPSFGVQSLGTYEGQIARAHVEGNDTILDLQLPMLYVYPPMEFKNEKQEKFYWATVSRVKKTLPYAKLIGGLLRDVNKQMEGMSERERKAFMKTKEDELVSAYTPILKKLSLKQGKMLIRLVDRECDRTSYDIVKELRGGFRAFFWQGFAKVLGADLKVEFDADKSEDDKIVERIINLVESGQL